MDKILVAGFCVALTIAAFAIGKALNGRLRHPVANATLIAILLVIAVLMVSHRSYGFYMQGGGLIGWLLGPATVALGIPLARQMKTILRDALPIGVAVVIGAAVSAVLAPAILLAFGGSSALALSMAPKSVTTPIAMGIAARIGGVPALAAVFAIVGGVIVAVIIEPVLGRLKIQDHRVFGLAAGVSGSGIAAAQAVNRHPQAGAYAALAIGVNSIVTAILVPVLVALHLL
jgi:putative effector of murein hydrolase